MATSKRDAQLTVTVKTDGAEKAAKEIQTLAKTSDVFQKQVAKVGRADEITQLANKFALVAKRTRDAQKAAADLQKELQKINATEDEIQGAAATFQGAQQGRSTNVLARAGSELRALPSTQTGLGFGTDAVGNVLRLSGALTEVAGQSKLADLAIAKLTPALGAQTAATIGAVAPIAAFVAAFGAIALAVKALTDATSQNVTAIKEFTESQRELNKEIAAGLTSGEAQEQLKQLNTELERQKGTLGELQGAYNAADEQLKDATVAGVSLGNAFSNTAKIFSGDEQQLADDITSQGEVVADLEGKIKTLTTALEDGSLAANDAAEAEKILAKERSDAALDSADTAAKELQAEQRALSATTEQNEKRLQSIEDERAVIEAQLEVLQASGVTSEEVTAKIESLNAQLGLLGKESAFINDVALEQSRQRDAEKKAKENAEKAARAQEQYNDAVKNATRQFKQSTQDIGIKFTQTLTDNNTKFNRDITDLTTKFHRDEFELELKANRAERDALKSQVNDIEKIRNDAREDELEALREGDFKALFLARENAAKQAQQETRALDRERDNRRQNLQDAREDLLRNAQQARSDRILAFERQNADARLAQSRELQQAALTRQRALQVARDGLSAELKQLGDYYQQRLKLDQQYYQQSLGMASGGKSGGASSGGKSSGAQGSSGTYRIVRAVIGK